ncbi:MAG: polysulfide reductase NrfD [Cyclobacteriaceae bacterium]
MTNQSNTLSQPMSLSLKLLIGSLLMVIGWGCYGLFIQLTQGHIVLGTRDNVVWGIYIVNFIFFIGLGYAGAVIVALLWLGKFTWRGPLVRLASIMMLISTIIGPIYILLEIGRFDRLHYLFMYARIQSPIFWDVIAVLTFLVGCVLFFLLHNIPDFAHFAKSDNISKRLQSIYSWLSFNYKGTSEQKALLTRSINILAVLIVPIAIIVSSILSWIFGMTLRPGWHSSIFGPYFVLAAIYSGLAVVAILLWISRKSFDLQSKIRDDHFKYLAYGIVITGLGYGYFTFSEYFTDWYTSKEWNAKLIESLFDFNQYGGWTAFANFGGILLPILWLGIPKFRNPTSTTIMSLLIVVAMWVKRYLIIIPTLENTLLPTQDLRAEYVAYTATWVEWSLIAASFAGFALFFILIVRFVGAVPQRIEDSEHVDVTQLDPIVK